MGIFDSSRRAERSMKRLKKREEKLRSKGGKHAESADLQFDYALNVAVYQDEIIKLEKQKRELFEKLKTDPSNNIYQLQFKKTSQSVTNYQKLVDLYKNEALREMLIEGLKEIPAAQKEILIGNPTGDEAIQVLAERARKAEAEMNERAKLTAQISREVYGAELKNTSGEFDDPEFLRMKNEESSREPAATQPEASGKVPPEIEMIKGNIAEITTRLRMQSFSYEEKIGALRSKYDGIKNELKEKLTRRETASAADCVFLDSDIDSLSGELSGCEYAVNRLLQAKSVCDSQLAIAEAVRHQAYIDSTGEFMVNGVVTDFKNAVDNLALYLKESAEKSNEEMAAVRMAVDVAQSVAADKSRTLSQSVLNGGLEQRFESKDENKYSSLKTKLGI